MDQKEFDKIITNEHFCAYPFVQISTVPAGFMRPCCFYADIIKNDDATSANVANDTYQKVWNNKDFKDLRKAMLEGKKVTPCIQCHRDDSHGGDSLRKRSLREWTWRKDFKTMVEEAQDNDGVLKSSVKFLELKPGNLCNLKCRMCNQFDSSKYAAELIDIGAKFKNENLPGQSRIFDEHNFEFDFNLSKMADWKNNTQTWQSFEKLAPSLEFLSIAGGEPTMIEEVYKALKFCVDQGYAKNITVYFASNFTLKMDRYLDLAKHFKRFDFIASIDGKDHVQEYIRFPSKWSDVSENFANTVKFASMVKNVNVLVNMTINIYNVFYFTEFLDWLEQDQFKGGLKEDPYNLNILMYPEYLSLQLFPHSLAKQAIDKIENYLTRSKVLDSRPHIRARFEQVLSMLAATRARDDRTIRRIKEFWIFTKIVDQHRMQSFDKLFPELSAAVDGELTSLQFDFDVAKTNFKISEI